jgi:hypothetical protein
MMVAIVRLIAKISKGNIYGYLGVRDLEPKT